MTALAKAQQLDPAMVLAKATVRASALLGMSGAALGRVVGLSPASISRVVAGEKAIAPDTKEGELAALLVRVYRSLDALVGNDERARLLWLASYNDALKAIPKERMESVQGLVEVAAYLDGMRAHI